MSERKFPKVGVGVVIWRDGKILLLKRKGSHGAGTWSLPGGHLEWGENPVQTGAREVTEETGLTVQEIWPLSLYTNDVFPNGEHHYITLYLLAVCTGEPRIMEPNKCDGWAWFSPSGLPSPLFLPFENFVRKGGLNLGSP
jgi:8-oxo-dGTP diphosphatase